MQQQFSEGWLWFWVEFTKAIAWPIVASGVVWRLGPRLMPFLEGRKVQLEGAGVRATFEPPGQSQASEKNPAAQTLEKSAPPLAGGPPRPAVAEMEQRIQAELAGVQIDNRDEVLLRNLAIARLQAGFEFTYNRIFGSQILGLKQLDVLGEVTVEQAREFFTPYAKQFPQIYAKHGFEGWLGFMTSGGLVAVDGDRLKPTTFGHEFLVYLREVRLSEAKPW
ncbi:MAG: hypothetical protein M0037_01485 [Betaproteobacteria bacterium]|nr:hypothetical protein [Betaproteobacteria bacterium]